MSSYDNPVVTTYQYANAVADFGTAAPADGVWSFKGPKGKRGRVIDLGVTGVTEEFVGTTSGGFINVGKTTGAYEHGRVEIAHGTAVGDAFSLADDNTDMPANGATDYIIAADAQVEVSVDICVGGSVAGKGWLYVTVGWFA